MSISAQLSGAHIYKLYVMWKLLT